MHLAVGKWKLVYYICKFSLSKLIFKTEFLNKECYQGFWKTYPKFTVSVFMLNEFYCIPQVKKKKKIENSAHH